MPATALHPVSVAILHALRRHRGRELRAMLAELAEATQ